MTALTKPVKKVVIVVDPVPVIKVQDESGDVVAQPLSGLESDTETKIYNNLNDIGTSKSSAQPKSILATSTSHSHTKYVTLRKNDAFYVEESGGTEYVSYPNRMQHIDSVVEESEDEALPEHHQVLYDLLGADKADSILNPKMEEPSKRDREKQDEVTHRRKLPAVDTGLGAEALWKILKRDTDKKLHKMDGKIPIEWKISYGAFLRDSINQSRPLVPRSFTKHTDVPELSKLLDQRYKVRVRRARHHANVMYRSSENNKNKTTVLLSNNPVPDYVDREGHLPVTRYFQNDLLYAEARTVLPTIRGRVVPGIDADNVAQRLSKQFANLQFLSEDQARTKGTFYGKYVGPDGLKMVTDFPGYKTKLPPSMTSRVTLSAPARDPGALRGSLHPRVLRGLHSQQREPTWQPLTVGALMEYAPTKRAAGFGDFRFGQASRWRTPAPSAV